MILQGEMFTSAFCFAPCLPRDATSFLVPPPRSAASLASKQPIKHLPFTSHVSGTKALRTFVFHHLTHFQSN